MKTRVLWIYLLLLIGLSACDTARKSGAMRQDDGIIELVFLQLNDVYEISPLSDNSGGLARVATLRKSLLAKNPNTFTVLAGDFISPSVIGTLKHNGERIRGKQMVETLNVLGLDWAVFGNHEFDYDLEDLQARLDESGFVWIAANARQKSGDMLHPFVKNGPDGEQQCPDYIIRDVKDTDGTTIKLGVFGVLVTTGQKDYVVYSDPLQAARQTAERLSSQVDLVVGLTHLDVEDDLKLAESIPGLPLIMGGHDHDNMLHKAGGAVVAKADANARTVYVHTLRYDKKSRKSTVRSELRRIDGTIPEEPATATVVSKWESIKNASLTSAGFDAGKKVTDLAEPLDCREAVIRHKQVPVGQLITKAMQAVAKGPKPDCILLNSGSIRVDDVLKGTITELDIVRMLPFGGGISEVEMRGSLLAQTLDAGLLNKGKGGYLQLLNVGRDDAGRQWLIGGAPLAPERTYQVVLPDFLLTGFETNMGFLKTAKAPGSASTDNPQILSWRQADPKDSADLRRDIRLALIQYLRSM